MAKYLFLLSILLLFCFVFSSSGKTPDSLVYATYLQWDSISSGEISENCIGDVKCLESRLANSKNKYDQAYIEYELIQQYERAGEFEKAKQLLIRKVAGVPHTHINYFDYRYLDLGLKKFVLWGEYGKAEDCLHQITSLFDSVECDSIFDLFTTYRKGGELYIIYLDMPLNAEVYFDKAFQVWELYQLDSAWLPPLLYDFAVLKNENQAFEIAEEYLIQTKQIAIKYPMIYGNNFLNQCSSLLAIIYGETHKDADAIKEIEKIIENANGNEHINYDDLLIDYLNLITYLILENRYQESFNYINTVEAFYNKVKFQDAADLFNIAISKSRAFKGLSHYSQAWEELFKAEKILASLPLKQQPSLFYTLVMDKTKLLDETGRLDEALRTLYALEIADSNSAQDFFKRNQGWQIEYFIMIGDLTSKRNQMNQPKTTPYHTSPYVYYNKADSVINLLRTNNSWRKSSTYLVEHYRNLTEKLLREYYNEYKVHKDQKYLNKVFNLIERNQALLINERVKQQSLKENANINSEVIKLGQAIELLENKVNKDRMSSDKIKLDQLYHKYNNAMNSLQADYSKVNLISLDKWKNKLKKEHSNWIEYFQGEQGLYILYSSNGLIDFTRVDFDNELKEELETIVKSLRTNSNDNFQTFERAAYNLQSALIPQSILNSKLKNLIIVQDGLLYFLPFEVLLKTKSEKNSFKKADYLLGHKNIRYSLSAALWKKTKIKKGAGILFAHYNDEVNQLVAAQSEVKNIVDIWKYKSKTVTTKLDFFKALDSANIVHIATHAASDTNQLGKNQMYFCQQLNVNCILESYELAPYDLTDKLVVLNGCETNYGKIIQGEGIFSWVRDFAVNGALTSISNMWKVSDLSAEQILTGTYKNWQKKGPISLALQQSKIDYLNNSHPLMAHPFYWANTIIIGDAYFKSKKFNLKNLGIPILFLMMILIALIIYFKVLQGNKL